MLGENIRKARIDAGLSQEELGEKLHVVRQTISKWEKGASAPSAELLLELAGALDADVESLLGADGTPSKSLDELAMHSALLNEQLSIQVLRMNKLVGILKGSIIAVIAIAVVAMIVWFVLYAFMPKDSRAIFVDYELDGEAGQVQIWLDSHDPSATRGWALSGEGAISDWLAGEGVDPTFSVNGADPMVGFLGESGSAQLALRAFEVAIESRGGKIVSISSYDSGLDHLYHPSASG